MKELENYRQNSSEYIVELKYYTLRIKPIKEN